MTGIELLRKVRASEEFADIPFLMVTAEAQQENIIEAVQAKVPTTLLSLSPLIPSARKLIRFLNKKFLFSGHVPACPLNHISGGC